MDSLVKAVGVDFDAANVLGHTPLHIAAKRNDPVTLEKLIKAGATLVNDYSHCLSETEEKKNEISNLTFLFSDYQNQQKVVAETDGRTPLHSAVLTNAVAALQILLRYDQSHQLSLAPDSKGRTPLHCAAFLGYAPVVRMLADAVCC